MFLAFDSGNIGWTTGVRVLSTNGGLDSSVELKNYLRSFAPFAFVGVNGWALQVKDVRLFRAEFINVEVKAATAVAVVFVLVKKVRALRSDVFGGEILANLFSGSVGSWGVILTDRFFRRMKNSQVGRWSPWKYDCGSACC